MDQLVKQGELHCNMTAWLASDKVRLRIVGGVQGLALVAPNFFFLQSSELKSFEIQMCPALFEYGYMQSQFPDYSKSSENHTPIPRLLLCPLKQEIYLNWKTCCFFFELSGRYIPVFWRQWGPRSVLCQAFLGMDPICNGGWVILPLGATNPLFYPEIYTLNA